MLQNNPHKSKDQILKRPDVQSALRQPYEQAAAASEKILKAAWDAAEAETLKKVKGEFKLLKEDWKGHETDKALLDSLVGDLHANAKAMRSRYREILMNPSSKGLGARLLSLGSDARLRASYSTSVAIWGVASQVRDSAFSLAGLNKMWIAVLDGVTCSHCRGLHGMVIPAGRQFPVDVGSKPLKVYKGKLFGPPRHPRCRCVIVGVKRLKKSKT